MNEFFTWASLGTYAGAVLATTIITQLLKGIAIFDKLPTRIFSYVIAVIVLLAGIFVATVFGRLESTYTARAKIQDGKAVLLIEGEAADEVDEGMTLRIKNEQAKIEDVYWVTQDAVEAVARIDLPDGNYDAEVVMEVISPISFLTN